MRRWIGKFLSLIRAGRVERELSREIDCHLRLLQDDFERGGLSQHEARLAALRAYGGVEQAKELHREERSFAWFEHLRKDVRQGVRSLLRSPGFTAVAVITLGLGIGANTAVFSVANAVLLRPLAYADPGRLVTLLHDGTAPVAPANYFDWRDQSRSFEAMAAAEAWGASLTGQDQPEQLRGLKVTPNLLPMLGVKPVVGRWLSDQKHEVVLSYRLWERRFDRDAGVLGRPITLNGSAYTVVGVMPADFRFAPFWATRAELWIPDTLADRALSRGGNSLRIFARLRPGVPLEQARAEVATITARLELAYPGTNKGVVVTPLKQHVVGKVETPLLILLGAVGFVLLIACANVAHMLLARTADRQREIAVRTALGASRARVVGQFLTENLMLAGLGALAGLGLAELGTKALVALSPAYLPRVELVSIDGTVLLFLLGLTVLTAFAFGLAPAMHATAGDLAAALKEGGRGSSDGAGRSRLRGFLVASEFALAFVLLVGAGLMIRTFLALQSMEAGFDARNVLSMVVSVAGSSRAEGGRRAVFYPELLQKVRALPGVQSASAINHLPLAGDVWGLPFRIEGRPRPRPGESPTGVYRIVMPGYFETMRLRLVRGRGIESRDDSRSPGVVVINERAASMYWPGEDPVGKRISLEDTESGTPLWLTVVGIAANAKQRDWVSEIGPEVYLAGLQNRGFLENGRPSSAYITLVVRTSGNSAEMASAVKDVVRSFDRNLPVSEVLTMENVVAEATAQPRFEMFLLSVFGGVALLLAAVGIYGVMSYAVSRRKHEIGIRMSLGAQPSDVLWIVVRQGMMQAVTGTAAGIAGALVLSNLMARMLYGVRPTDPLTFAGVAMLLGVVAMVAALVPASKAVGVEPVVALRSE